MSALVRLIGDAGAVARRADVPSALRWEWALLRSLPSCVRQSSLTPADKGWLSRGAKFRPSRGARVRLPGPYTAGAREMYCRNVYLRTGLEMPTRGWVVDLGANRGLFSVWAACSGADVVAVEAQQGFAPQISSLAAVNGVGERVHVETAMASGVDVPGATVGVLADDTRWAAASDSVGERPAALSMPDIMTKYDIDEIGLLKVDIEGGEFAVLAEEDLSWLGRVRALVLEVHRDHGDVPAMLDRVRAHGFTMELRDNDGASVDAASSLVEYAYFSR